MKRVFGYVRVSSRGQVEDGQSLEVQEDLIRRYFEWKFAPEGFHFEGIIKDPAVSASVPIVERPGGLQLTQRIDKGDAVVFCKLDRGFRDTIDCLTTVKDWKKRNINVHMLDLPVQDLTSDMGMLFLTMLAAFAEWERKRFVQRCNEGKARKRAKGSTPTERFIGGSACVPWGFKLVGRRKCKLVYDWELRKTAQWFIELHQSGWDYRTIWLHCLQRRIFRSYRGKTREWMPDAIKNAIRMERALQVTMSSSGG